ncbi:MAG TPA: DEAD/DEAH box helicase [Patescibacteria group bacterium]|jgi:superfamily II DNA/RNA helicase
MANPNARAARGRGGQFNKGNGQRRKAGGNARNFGSQAYGNKSLGGRGGGTQRQRSRGPAKSTIDPSRFVNRATSPRDILPYTPRRQFKNFAFDPRMHRAITSKGYTAPTAIQDQAIPHILAGHDVVGIANTGTGKTAGFVLPIINRLIPRRDGMALVVAPTRELAQQIDEEFRSFADRLDLLSTVCVGGMNERPQIKSLKRNPQMVIGTPGRLKDFVTNKHLDLKRCHTFVLDEADRMLDMGFINDMKFLMRYLPEERQSLCFSATITPEVKKIIDALLDEPVTVSVRTTETQEHIEQDVIRADTAAEKLAHLEKLLVKPEFSKVVIFGQTKHGVQRLSDKLSKRNISVTTIHGNKNQNQRRRALSAFKSGPVKVLVATDVAARGLDIRNVSHVINYDPPQAYDDYIHRIGRTGRAGKTGSAITFVPTKA